MIFDDGLQCSLFRVLQTDPQISQRALAKALGISLGKTNYCLKAFIDKGWIRPRRFQHNENKKGYAYIITSDGLAAKKSITVQFLQCKLMEYEVLQEEIEELRREIQDHLPCENGVRRSDEGYSATQQVGYFQRNQSMKMKIMTIAGARPNFMKMASIVEAIRRHNRADSSPVIKHILVHTGQHYDESLSKCFFDQLGLPRPDVNLGVGSNSHAQQTAEIMRRFEPVLLAERPDMLIVVGDVNSTVACALVAAKIQYPSQNSTGIERPLIVHVEAGLRSGDRSMPEEINRLLTDALSDALFVTEEVAVTNLLREGIPMKKIFFVGNVMIDTLYRHLEKARRSEIKKIFEIKGRYGLVTLHRPSNVDTKDALEPLIRCFQQISEHLFLVLPLHPRTRASLERFGLLEEFNHTQGISLIDPLGYLDFLNLLESSTMVLTDSGGIQEETTALGVPCITLRENTERPVTITMGTNYLVGTDPARILATVMEILSGRGKRGKMPPYWDGLSGERIVASLIKNCSLF